MPIEGLIQNERIFLDGLAKKLGFKQMADWYRVRHRDIKNNGGSTLLRKHQDSPSKLLNWVYPDHKWLPWRFQKVSVGFWNQRENQKLFLDWLGHQMGFQGMENWYGISANDLATRNGRELLKKYDDSPLELICSVYPDHAWNRWKFLSFPRSFSLHPQEMQQLVHHLQLNLNIRELEDWYAVSPQQLYDVISASLFHLCSLWKILLSVYPNHSWEALRFIHRSTIPGFPENNGVVENAPVVFPIQNPRKVAEWMPVNFNLTIHQGGSNRKRNVNQRKFMDWLGNQLGFKEMDEWYKLTKEDLIKNGAIRLLDVYDMSLPMLMQTVYPLHKWKFWRFEGSSINTSPSKEDSLEIVNWLAQKLQVKSLDDWYRIPASDIRDFTGMKYLLLEKVLPSVYPHHLWNTQRFGQALKASQRKLTIL